MQSPIRDRRPAADARQTILYATADGTTCCICAYGRDVRLSEDRLRATVAHAGGTVALARDAPGAPWAEAAAPN